MDEVGGARRGPPKLREILRRQRQDSEVIELMYGFIYSWLSMNSFTIPGYH